MLTELFLLAVAAGALVALDNWRLGVLVALLVGAAQDPVRKLTPDQAPILAIASLPLWMAALLGLWRRDRQALQRVERAHPRLGRLVRAFLALLVPPTALVFLLYGAGAWKVALFGLFAYVAPLLIVAAGFSFPRSPADIRRLLSVYGLIVGVMLVGTYLQYAGLFEDSPALGTRVFGFETLRYTVDQGAFVLIAGFYRSPDLMAWHAATLTMVGLTLASARKGALRYAWLLAVGWGIFSVLVAGRRKAVIMPLVWILVVAWTHLRTRRLSGAIVALGIAGVAASGFFLVAGEVVQQQYYGYAASVAADAPERLLSGTFGTVVWTVLETGFFGRGIGTASQGMQYVAANVQQGWQESGPARLVAELGVPGLVAVALLAFSLGRTLLLGLQPGAGSPPDQALHAGCAGIVVASAVSFLVSHQIYTDLSVLGLSSLMTGLVLASPRWLRAGASGRTVAPARRQPPPAAGGGARA